jgi:hypothetical protein
MREAGDTPCKRHRRAKAPCEAGGGCRAGCRVIGKKARRVKHNLERHVGEAADAARIVEEGIVLLKTRVKAAAAADPTE